MLAPKHSYFCKTICLKCLTVFWICLCLHNCLLICTVTLCYVLHQTHSEYWHIQNSIYSGIFKRIQEYLALLRHFHSDGGIVKTNSGLFRYIQHSLLLLYINNLALFRVLAYLEQEAISKVCETYAYSEVFHSQSSRNNLFRHYSAIFCHIQNFV